LQQTGYITPQHLMLIDTILTMPEATIEAEFQHQIQAIYAVIDFSDVKEGSPVLHCLPLKAPLTKLIPTIPVKECL
jgi:hypothetical protein